MWVAPSKEQARCVVSLVREQQRDTVLVSSLCGGRVATHSLLLALHSPLLARLLIEAGTGTHANANALTLPFTLQVIRGLVNMMQGEDKVEVERKVQEAADFLGIFIDQVVKNIEKKEESEDIKMEVTSGNSSADDLDLKTKNSKDLKKVKSQRKFGIKPKKTPLIKGSNELNASDDELATNNFKSDRREIHAESLYGEDDVSDEDENDPDYSDLENSRLAESPQKNVKKPKSGSRQSKMLDNQFPCDHCNFSLKTEVALNRHMNRKHGIPIPCLKCNEEFDDTIEYKEHMKTKHTCYDCKICHAPMTSASTLSVHMQSHQEAMPCPYCGKEYNSRTSLSSHVIREHGEEEFQCTKCDYKTKVSNELKGHYKRRHTEQMQATCESCGDVFKDLKKHILRNTCGALGKIEKVKVSCKLNCGKTFCSNDKMLNHVKNIHGNIKDKVCSQCSYATYSNFNLKLHITKMHLGMEMVKEVCPYCEKETTSLNYHIQMYHSEKELENKSFLD